MWSSGKNHKNQTRSSVKYQQQKMATPKAIKKAPTVIIDVPECPVCMETMSAPIFQCQSGHSLCNSCTQNLLPPICPICRQNLTQMRNWQLEEIVAKVKVPCPNKSSGCVYTMMSMDLEEHLEECIFREMDCPLGVVFGKCSWTGKLKDMMEHFKDRHASHCNVATDEEVELTNVDIKNDDRHFYLVAQSKFLFILTMKIDTLLNMVYWTVQHIGSKKIAQHYSFEIHVLSKHNPQRKVVFTEHCFSDAIKPEEIFRQGKCAVLPLEVLVHYIKDKKLSFRFFIKRIPPPPPKNKNCKSDGNNVNPGPKPAWKGLGPERSRNVGENKLNGAGPHSKPEKMHAQSQGILRNSQQLSHPFTLCGQKMGYYLLCFLDFRSTMKFNSNYYLNYVYPIGIYSCTML